MYTLHQGGVSAQVAWMRNYPFFFFFSPLGYICSQITDLFLEELEMYLLERCVWNQFKSVESGVPMNVKKRKRFDVERIQNLLPRIEKIPNYGWVIVFAWEYSGRILYFLMFCISCNLTKFVNSIFDDNKVDDDKVVLLLLSLVIYQPQDSSMNCT